MTTAIMGNCGIGFAPVRHDRHGWLVDLMEGVEDIPGSALSEGIAWEWESFGEYLDALERRPRAVDVGAQIPHAAVRGFVMGDRAQDRATPADIAAMSRIVADGLRAGALGMSFGRTAGHRSVSGEPVPGTYSEEAELAYAGNNYDHLHDMMSDPVSLQGLGDGGAHCGIICDASMTTYLLSHWVRGRSRGPGLSLQTAVHRLTGDPARFYRLGDRGVLAPGRRADINLIDLERLRLHYPERVEDLPGGAGRLIQRSDGYVETLVLGQTVVADGELTDARPGGLVRGCRPARLG